MLWVDQYRTPVSAGYVIVGSVTGTSLNGATECGINGSSYAYVASFVYDGISVVDISNPASPSIVGSVTSSTANNISTLWYPGSGNFAYGARTSAGGQHSLVFDISTPTAPTLSTSLSNATIANVTDLLQAGNYAFSFSSNDRFVVVNINNVPPTLQTSLLLVNCSGVFGGSAFLGSNHAVGTDIAFDAIQVVGISTPTAPTDVAFFTDAAMDGPADVACSGTTAFVACTDNDSLVAIDLSTPASPSVTGSVSHADLDMIDGVVLDGSIAHCTSTQNDRITAVDISNPASMSVVTSFTDTLLDGISRSQVANGYIYSPCINSDRFVILDYS